VFGSKSDAKGSANQTIPLRLGLQPFVFRIWTWAQQTEKFKKPVWNRLYTVISRELHNLCMGWFSRCWFSPILVHVVALYCPNQFRFKSSTVTVSSDRRRNSSLSRPSSCQNIGWTMDENWANWTTGMMIFRIFRGWQRVDRLIGVIARPDKWQRSTDCQ
jgi:hypothetical protein